MPVTPSVADHTAASGDAKSEPLAELGVAPDRTLMVGDTTHDLQMAQNAGVAGLAAAFGAHPREQLLAMQPLACFDEPQALWQWLIDHA